MEAANRGAADAGGKTIGLNIGLPFEQFPNPYITPELSFEFHYFFMRKLWFAYLAKALIVFPGGFGTLDEMMEVLTLSQTQKLAKKIAIVLYGSSYWKEVINFDALVRHGTIGAADLDLFRIRGRSRNGVRHAEGSPDDAPAAGDGGNAGDIKVAQPAEASRRFRRPSPTPSAPPNVPVARAGHPRAASAYRRRCGIPRSPWTPAARLGLPGIPTAGGRARTRW